MPDGTATTSIYPNWSIRPKTTVVEHPPEDDIMKHRRNSLRLELVRTREFKCQRLHVWSKTAEVIQNHEKFCAFAFRLFRRVNPTFTEPNRIVVFVKHACVSGSSICTAYLPYAAVIPSETHRQRIKRICVRNINCHYQGQVRGHDQSRVALSACNGLQCSHKRSCDHGCILQSGVRSWCVCSAVRIQIFV